jgi:ubiquinone/menaquinone biosynthesis C-methylase UbiE
MFALTYARVIDPVLRDIRVYTPDFAGMKTGDMVLDVCCATGDQVFHYARRGISAVGIDLDPRMVVIADESRRKRGLTSVSFQIADAEKLPFQDNSFDYTSISLALHEKERPARDRVISEMKRVVKDEGALVFIDFKAPLPRNAYAFLIRVVEFIAGWSHFRCSRDYLEQGGLGELLKRHQLCEEKIGYLKYGTIAIIKARNV